jgi:hypothetical protein
LAVTIIIFYFFYLVWCADIFSGYNIVMYDFFVMLAGLFALNTGSLYGWFWVRSGTLADSNTLGVPASTPFIKVFKFTE